MKFHLIMNDSDGNETSQLITFDQDVTRLANLLIQGQALEVQEMTIPLRGWTCRAISEFEGTVERLNDGFMDSESIATVLDGSDHILREDEVLETTVVVQECLFINIGMGSFQVNLIDNRETEWWSHHVDIAELEGFKPGQPAPPPAPLLRYAAYVATQVTIKTAIVVQARSVDEANEKLQAKALEERGNYAKWAHENLPDDHKFEISIYNVTPV